MKIRKELIGAEFYIKGHGKHKIEDNPMKFPLYLALKFDIWEKEEEEKPKKRTKKKIDKDATEEGSSEH